MGTDRNRILLVIQPLNRAALTNSVCHPMRRHRSISCPELARLPSYGTPSDQLAIFPGNRVVIGALTTVYYGKSLVIRGIAGEGSRTPVCSLGSCRSTIELHPQRDFRF